MHLLAVVGMTGWGVHLKLEVSSECWDRDIFESRAVIESRDMCVCKKNYPSLLYTMGKFQNLEFPPHGLWGLILPLKRLFCSFSYTEQNSHLKILIR